MGQLGKASPNQQGHLPTHLPIAESVEPRTLPVTLLIRRRRRIALAYRRSQSDIDRDQLEAIDRELASYNIDIPGIERSVAQRKA